MAHRWRECEMCGGTAPYEADQVRLMDDLRPNRVVTVVPVYCIGTAREPHEPQEMRVRSKD